MNSVFFQVEVNLGQWAVPEEQVCGTYPNGQALWIHDRGDRFLYAGNDGYWYVGDEEEQDQNFACESGYIRHAGAVGLLPHQLRGAFGEFSGRSI